MRHCTYQDQSVCWYLISIAYLFKSCVVFRYNLQDDSPMHCYELKYACTLV